MTTAAKIDQAVKVAREVMADEAPGLLTLTHVAERVASDASVTTATARNWLRTACEAGELYEVVPDYVWHTDLPGSDQAGIIDLCLSRTWAPEKNNRDITIITRGRKEGQHRPGGWGPGKTTFLMDRAAAEDMVEAFVAERQAKKEAERQAYADYKTAEAAEIKRREPGLMNLMRRLRFLTDNRQADANGSWHSGASASTNLMTVQDESIPMEDRELWIETKAWGPESTTILRSILDLGVNAYLETQPVTLCRHCDHRVLPGLWRDGVWWHVQSTNVKCRNSDTQAEPAKEEETT